MINKNGLRKGAWSREEDNLLRQCIEQHGEGRWHQIPQAAGLKRCRKSCRLRWMNYLKPDIKRGEFEEDEIDLMLRLHNLLGNRWSLIAGRLPGRTANDVKNFWNTRLREKPARFSVSTKHKYSSQKSAAKPITLSRPEPRRLISASSPCLTGEDQIQSEKKNISMASSAPLVLIEQKIDWLKAFLEEEEEEGSTREGYVINPTSHPI